MRLDDLAHYDRPAQVGAFRLALYAGTILVGVIAGLLTVWILRVFG